MVRHMQTDLVLVAAPGAWGLPQAGGPGLQRGRDSVVGRGLAGERLQARRPEHAAAARLPRASQIGLAPHQRRLFLPSAAILLNPHSAGIAAASSTHIPGL
jgi:hypothetical protein